MVRPISVVPDRWERGCSRLEVHRREQTGATKFRRGLMRLRATNAPGRETARPPDYFPHRERWQNVSLFHLTEACETKRGRRIISSSKTDHD
jgi:hypothetical protein